MSGMRSKIVTRNPEILGEADDSIDAFLDHFPTVSREQVIAFLEEAREQLVAGAD